MKAGMFRFKVLAIWFFAILFTAAHPAESKETVKEIEETVEVKLYFQNRTQVKQKPKASESKSSLPLIAALHSDVLRERISRKHPRYILYCNLIYYE